MAHLFLFIIACIGLLAPMGSAQTYTLMSNLPYHVSQPVRMTINAPFSTFVVNKTYVRLSTTCNVGTTYTGVNQVPVGTVGNIIGYTSGESRPQSESTLQYWNVQFVEANAVTAIAANFAQTLLTQRTEFLVCLSTNSGVSWVPVSNAQGRQAFNIWSNIPTATLLPRIPITSTATVITLPSKIYRSYNGTVSDVIMRVVADPSYCNMATPTVIGGGGPVTMSASGTFSFTFSAAVAQAYICLSANAGTVWSLIPVNDFKNTTASVSGFTSTGQEPTDYSFPIILSTLNRFSLSCTPQPIAGVSTTCTIQITTSAGAATTTTAANIAILELTDGSGVSVCPLPTVTQNGAVATITFVPQRTGREARLRLSLSGNQILANSNADIESYYTWGLVKNSVGGTSNQRVITAEMRDNRISHMFVQPGPEDVFPYSYTNQLTFSSFTGNAAFTYQNGVKWYTPRSTPDTTYEPLAATLVNTTTTGTMYQSVSIPTRAERCRVAVKYYFTAETSTSLSTNSFIGSIKVSAYRGATEVVIREYKLYSYLQYIIVTGGANNYVGQLDGYFRTEEQLVVEVPVLPSYTNIRVTLSIDHTDNKNLYYIDPQMTCVITPATPDTATSTEAIATNSGDVTALQSIYTTLGGSMSNWRETGSATFNGDPCRNQWKGVICRRNRVVELQLRGQKLAGTMPSLSAMDALEVIDVRDNNLTGVWNIGTTQTRLREVRIANNLITSIISSGTFSHASHTCLNHFDAQNNLITAFPATGLTTLSSLVTVDISRNAMASTLPTSFSSMTSLVQLNLGQNALTGSLPATIPTANLRSFDLNRNALTGPIPATYTNFRNLQFFDVSFNQLSGIIPVTSFANVRSGAETVFLASHNFFTYLPPRHQFRREAVKGNFFQCPNVFDREQHWLPDANYYHLPMQCDWTNYTNEQT